MGSWGRWIGWGAAGTVLVLVVGLFAAGLRLAPLSAPHFDAKAAIAAGQSYDAEIMREAYGVPHVFGKTDADAAFAAAYAHAQDDFTTLQTVLAGSRGANALARNTPEVIQSYLLQTFGIRALVNERYQNDLSPDVRAVLKGYADGLNYYAALHPDEVQSHLFPVSGQDVVSLVAFSSTLFYGMSETLTKLLNPEGTRSAARGQELQTGLINAARTPDLGSNGFAVAPSRSADGKVRLLINSHQPVAGPLAWYELRMTSEEGLNFIGGTFPGSPLPLHGHNDVLGWAATINRPDLIDVYELTVNPDNPGQYRLDGDWVDFERGEARILVHLWGPFAWEATRKIIRSRHGPALRTPSGTFAVRYASMNDIRYMEEQYRLVKARTLEEFTDALKMGAQANQNRIYADKDGNIAMFYMAKIPKRVPGFDYKKTLPGDRSDLIWTEFVEFDSLPHTINPPDGFVVNSNHTPFRSTGGPADPRAQDYPAEHGIETRMTNRGLRALELFRADTDISREDFLAYKFDTAYHPESLAARIREEILGMEFPDEGLMQEAQSLLAAWSLELEPDNKSAPLAIMTMQPIGFARHLGYEPPKTEDAFADAARTLITHYGRLDVPWATVNRLERGGISLSINGGPDTLRAVASEPTDNGRLRMIAGDGLVIVAEWDRDGTVRSDSIHHFGSAVMRPGSPHYADQTALFVAETLKPVPLTPDAQAAATSMRYRPGDELAWSTR